MDDLTPDSAIPTARATGIEYAGFWRRFNAYGIDATFVWLFVVIIQLLAGGDAHAQTSPDDMQQLQDALAAAQTGQVSPALMASIKQNLMGSMLGGSVLGADTKMMIVVSAIYNIFFVHSDLLATPGKYWLKCKVVNADGSRLTLLQSALRHAATGFSAVFWLVPCITIFWSHEKLAPHDMLCNTRVIMRQKA